MSCWAAFEPGRYEPLLQDDAYSGGIIEDKNFRHDEGHERHEAELGEPADEKGALLAPYNLAEVPLVERRAEAEGDDEIEDEDEDREKVESGLLEAVDAGEDLQIVDSWARASLDQI